MGRGERSLASALDLGLCLVPIGRSTSCLRTTLDLIDAIGVHAIVQEAEPPGRSLWHAITWASHRQFTPGGQEVISMLVGQLLSSKLTKRSLSRQSSE
jgi:hypothetical protein